MKNKGKRIEIEVDLENTAHNDEIWNYLKTKIIIDLLVYLDQINYSNFISLTNIVGSVNGMHR